MHVVQINYAFDRAVTDPDALLTRYSTLTGWSEALAGAARVTVVQRFSRDAAIRRRGVDYLFRRDGRAAEPRPWTWSHRLHRAVAALAPDLVHVNGLIFPVQAWLLRCSLPPGAAMVVQDHASGEPRAGRRGGIDRWWLTVRRHAMQAPDGFLFSAPEQENPWRTAGLIAADRAVYHVMEASTDMRAMPRDAARGMSAVNGAPALLWVGRLNANKDPLTVLEAFAMSLSRLPLATLTMIYSAEGLLGPVREYVEARPSLRTRVRLVGRVPHEDLVAFYSAADIFVLGSHHEGSGYAVLEAAACGAVPVVTEIPAFRITTASGSIGALWPAGDACACAAALVDTWQGNPGEHRARLREHFERALSWPAIGRQALAAYEEIVTARRARLGARAT